MHDLHEPELPETNAQWADRLYASARNGETLVLRQGERRLSTRALELLAQNLRILGGHVHLVPGRRPG